MQLKFISSLCCALAVCSALSAQQPTYLNENAPIDQRVEDALSRMTLEEKVAICHAQSKFSSPGVARLGIPGLWCTDGPHGIRPEVLWDEWDQAGWTNDSCIAFPALTCLAATWNPAMAEKYGRALGEEAAYRGKNVLLGPGVNIYRSPLNGRNFEYMSEDPYLTAQMVVPYIDGVQSNGVAACVKHYALNNQETTRHGIDVMVDDRALYEIYLPAFKAAIEGGAWSIMGSYNCYKGQFCCHNQYLLNDILRKEWNFKGAVISDWGGVHDTRQAALNGLDLEFGTWTNGLSNGSSNAYDNYYLALPYLKMLQSGELPMSSVDDKVRHVLRLIFQTSMNKNKAFGSMASAEHISAARTVAQEGIVLLKNENALLPISATAKNILVVGENAIKMMTVGGGSSSLKAKYEISPLDGIRQRAGKNINVTYARGYVGDTGGEYNGVTSGQDLTDNRSAAELTAEAVDLAKKADYVLFIGGLNKSANQDCEDSDRKSYALPYGQDDLIAKLAQANKNLVVINVSGNAVEMNWEPQVAAIMQAWYLGTESGHALADILFGDVCPSGKLPFTFMKKLEDYPSHSVGEFPGNGKQVHYTEGIFVGYRYADAQKKLQPLFAFGHGLSYTTFSYGKAALDKSTLTADGKITLSIDVTNTGNCAGAEVVQLYISDKKSSLPRPVKELKAFQKVKLAAGQTQTLHFSIAKEDLQFFDADKHAWIAEPGQFEAIVGASSKDLRSKVAFELK